MKVIIPAKTNSSRVLDKNWREFHDGRCLVDIKIEQLKAADIAAEDIHVFCEDDSHREQVERAGANFAMRASETTVDDMHWSDVITTLVSSVECPEGESVAWVYACTPLFGSTDFISAIQQWESVRGEFDSLITVKPFKEFVLNADAKPMNFSFGRWHEWSQDLPQWYVLESPIHIMEKRTYLRCNYYIGEKPYMYVIEKPSIDIDTPEEFSMAQDAFSKMPESSRI